MTYFSASQIRRRKPSLGGYIGAYLVIGITTLTILHYSVIAGQAGTKAIKQWALRTFNGTVEAPTKLIRPVPAFAEEIIPTQTPTLTRKDIIFSKKHGDIIWRIYGLESSYGTANGYNQWCRSKGMWNDFGYAVHDKVCFHTFEESVNAVENWVEKHADLPLGKMLCYYNQGNKKYNCDYSGNFLEL
jgi:hypothetical protein